MCIVTIDLKNIKKIRNVKNKRREFPKLYFFDEDLITTTIR